MRIGDVVRFQIIEVLAHFAAVRTAARRALKRALEFHSPLYQPAVAERQKKNRIDLRVDLILTGRDEIEVAGATAENGDWLIGIERLSGRVSGHKRQKTQGRNHRQDGGPDAALPGFSFQPNRQVNQDATPRKPMS